MKMTGDRQGGRLLSALAEAPDSAAASSFLANQIAEMSGAARVVILRLDAAQEALITVASNELSAPPVAAISIADLSNPLVISALALNPISGRRPLAAPFDGFAPWTALPMTQPRSRNAPMILPAHRAADLLAPMDVTVGPHTERVGAAPGGVAVIDRALAPDLFEELSE